MKLNKYLFSTFIAASTLLISSCSDFLDRSPQGQFTEDDNPNALVNGKIYNVYTMMRSFDITAGTPAIIYAPKTPRKEVSRVTDRM